ncbi:FecR domain-containing protein [Bradyrhizobium sp. dw_411]|uniref:Npun_F0296 family exosortase-dependent surface protein n=1 Tax=Bradyrhizobium sp. dw_411 TaxID=2720082 RepID=UPI001C49DC51|nr:FecR domain-containing protein [Bradyrhizobium sp. dw_411]
MNYASKFDGKLFVDSVGVHAGASAHGDHVSPHTTHAPADAIIVPDAHLLFNGDFKRSGVDLILSADDQKLVLHDYFKGEKRAALASPDGAHLTGDIVKALSGHVEYAQADGSASVNKVIGHVTKLAGSATAIRNGVSIILNQGDNVEKGDVVQSGSGSTVGITFIDGTVFGLSSNARMVLNEMVYDPNGSNNSSLLSLVAGTITFVAGETAKHGDMKIDTPVATMGIRGTAVLVEIDFDTAGQNGLPDTKFQVLVEPDGTTGSYILFDKVTLTPFAVVDRAGTQFSFSNGNFSQSLSGLTPEVQKLITDVFAQRFSDNTNTKTFDHHTDTPIPDSLAPFKVGNITVTPIILLVSTPVNTQTQIQTGSGPQLQHIPGAPTAVLLGADGQPASAFKIGELPSVTGSTAPDKVSGIVNFADVNAGDLPTVSAKFDGSTYTDPHGNALSLNTLQLADIKAVEVDLAVTATPGNNNHGSASWSYTVPDGSFDFLAAGETLQLTYTLTVDNNYAPADETTPLKFTITITGTNDVPVITTGAQTIHFSGGKGTIGGDLAPTSETSGVTVIPPPPGMLTYSEKGTLTFTDPDLTDTHSIVAPGPTGDLTGASLAGVSLDLTAFQQQFPIPFQIFENALSASIGTDSTGTGTGTINWTFAELPSYVADFIPSGEALILTYTVEVKDSQGAISTQTITVTIGGNDAPAVVWIDTKPAPPSGALWSDGSNWETGNAPTIHDDAIIITNQLQPNFPTYPVAIDSAASAKSLEMNDVTGKAPILDNNDTLTVAGGITLNVDAVLNNFGNISVGSLATLLAISGLAEILDHSVLNNSGTLALAHGGDFLDQSSITNSGTIEIIGDTLDIEVAVANAGGIIQVDSGAKLKLNGTAINGGTITDNGSIDVTANSSINGAVAGTPAVTTNALLNNGGVTIESDVTLTLDNVTVTGTTFTDTASGAILSVDATDTLTLDNVTVDGGILTDNGTINVDATNTLKLSGVALSGGKITNAGTIEIIGSGSINNDIFSNTQLTVDANQILTLDGTAITGGILTDTGTVNVDATDALKLSGVALSGGKITNAGTIEITGSGSINNDVFSNTQLTIDANQILTLDGTAITGGILTDNGTVNVDATDTLKLSGVALSGGKITNAGTIEIAGSGSINNDIFSNTQLTVDANQILTLDGTAITGGILTDNGTVNVDATDTLKLSGVALSGGKITNAGTIEITGSGSINNDIFSNTQLTIDANQILTLNGTAITGGILTDTGTINIDATNTLKLSGVALSGGKVTNAGTIEITGSGSINNDVFSNTQLTVDANQILTLDGTSITGGIISNNGTVNVDATDTLKLSGVALSGGKITNSGTIEITGSGSINNDIFSNVQLTVDANQILTLDGTAITGGILTDTGTINVDATDSLKLSGVALSGGKITNAGTIEITGSGSINDDIFSNTQLTIDANQILTLDGTAITGGIIGNNGTIHIDASSTLKLSGVALSGGTITNAGTIDVASNSSINGVTTGGPPATTTVNAILNGGLVTVESGAALTLDNVTVNGTVFNDLVTGGTIQIDSGDTLTFNGATINGGILNISGELDSTGNSFITGATIVNENHINVVSGTLTIDPTPVTNTGTIEVKDGSTLVLSGEVIANSVTTADGTTKGIIQVDATDPTHFATLDLDGSTIDGGTLTIGGELDSTGNSFITGVTITNTGTIDVTGGTLTIDATSTLDTSHGVVEASGGHLTINAAIVGNLEIKDGAVLELGSSSADAYSQATVTFDPGAMGILKLDHSQHFGGTISGFSAGDVIDLADLKYSSAETYIWNSATNTLTIRDGTQIETLKLDGTYSHSGFVLERDADGSTDLVTSPPKIVGETNPPTETVILTKSPIVLAAGVDTNSLNLGTESFDNLSAGSTSNNGFGHGTFFSSALGATFTASGDAGVVHGSSGVSAAPFMGPVPGQPDTTNYLSIGAHGSETISFASEQNEFGLYWGSVDSFNTINFYNGTTLVASYDGADISPLLSNGNQGSFASNGYVEFLDLSPFNKVVLATGDSSAFEIDNVSAGFTSDSHIQLATPMTGTLTVSDAEVGDTLTASVIGEGVVKYDGSTTLPSGANVAALIDPDAITFDSVTTTAGLDTLHWTYNPANADLDFLEPHDTLTVTFEAKVTDGHATTVEQPLTITVVGTNASVVNGTAQNDTFVNIGGNVTIFGKGGQDTFVFKPNFGSATIADFSVSNDTIDIDHSLFASVSALLTGAHSANSGHDVILTDAAHDTITLKNLSLTQLQFAAQHGDFHIT